MLMNIIFQNPNLMISEGKPKKPDVVSGTV